jgi:hypothetical protein
MESIVTPRKKSENHSNLPIDSIGLAGTGLKKATSSGLRDGPVESRVSHFFYFTLVCETASTIGLRKMPPETRGNAATVILLMVMTNSSKRGPNIPDNRTAVANPAFIPSLRSGNDVNHGTQARPALRIAECAPGPSLHRERRVSPDTIWTPCRSRVVSVPIRETART